MTGSLSQTRGRPEPEITLRALSLGAGVQSSTLYLMAVRGEFGEERPTVAIFADTQWEPRRVYDWLDFLESVGGHVIPIRRITAGNVRDLALRGGRKHGHGRALSLPYWTRDPEGTKGKARRHCTSELKVRPIIKETRRLLGYTGRRIPAGVVVESWQGISLDEATRMRDSRDRWIRNYYPLVERRMTRHSCLTWMSAHDFPLPPKSACIGCPFTSDHRWRDMRENAPEEWADAIAFDRSIRTAAPGLHEPAYLHSSLEPLEDVDLTTAEERGQQNLFENECEGMCGV